MMRTWAKDGVPRIDAHTLEITQRGERLLLDADRARPVEQGLSMARRAAAVGLRSLIGWYRSTE